MMLVPRNSSRFDLFDSFFNDDDLFTKKTSNLMKTDIKEKNDKYVILVDVPGCEKENIDLSLNNGYLEISAKMEKESNDEEEGKYLCHERFVGHCSRSFYVGDNLTEEDIGAEFKNGILKIEVPKIKETPEVETKKIEIK